MTGGNKLTDLQIGVVDRQNQRRVTLYADVFDNSLSRKWITALQQLLIEHYHLEKNFCWVGWPHSERNGEFILEQINRTISAINASAIGYIIDDRFTMQNCLKHGDHGKIYEIDHARLNVLHRYFEELQGTSGEMSLYWTEADPATRWHIRQLNLLCHEFECWALSYRKKIEAPEWIRPSTLMCWLNAPRFRLDDQDHELFGISTLNRDLGGIYLGVNKAVGKHHWEVFNDEGRDSRIGELTTTGLRAQTEAAGDFDIEWGQSTKGYAWQQVRLDEFRQWLIDNHFDPDDPGLTIGHPKVAQIDLLRSFGTDNYKYIWQCLESCLDVEWIDLAGTRVSYDYHWSDGDYQIRQIEIIKGTYHV